MSIAVAQRLYAKVDYWTDVDGCWPWGTNAGQYGRLTVGGKLRLAHRVAYELAFGRIAPGRELHHLCGNKQCVNVKHLLPVTRAEHHRIDGRASGYRGAPKTHCPQGHPYDDVNTYVYADGRRSCRTCTREKSLAYYHAHKENTE